MKVSEAEHVEGGTVDIVAREVFAAIPGADGPMALRNVQKLASTGLTMDTGCGLWVCFVKIENITACKFLCLGVVVPSHLRCLTATLSLLHLPLACPLLLWIEERDISLADLASMSLPDLVSAFGKAKGRRMFDFLNYSVD